MTEATSGSKQALSTIVTTNGSKWVVNGHGINNYAPEPQIDLSSPLTEGQLNSLRQECSNGPWVKRQFDNSQDKGRNGPHPLQPIDAKCVDNNADIAVGGSFQPRRRIDDTKLLPTGPQPPNKSTVILASDGMDFDEPQTAPHELANVNGPPSEANTTQRARNERTRHQPPEKFKVSAINLQIES